MPRGNRRPDRRSSAGASSSSRHPLTRERHEVTIATGTAAIVPDPDVPSAWIVEVNGVPSSYVDLDAPDHVGFEYLEIMLAVLDVLVQGPLSVLHLGAAGCSLARAVDAGRPGSRQVAVDVDTTLLTQVRDWFDLPRSPALRLRAGDARAVLSASHPASRDVVVRDAFAPDVTPQHLTTAEFTGQVARVLRPGGVYLANVADGQPLDRARREAATAREVFGEQNVALVAEPSVLRGRRYGNLVLVAVRPEPDDATGRPSEHPPAHALTSARLERRLWSLATPVRILTHHDRGTGGDELGRLVAGARPLRDPEPPAAHPGQG